MIANVWAGIRAIWCFRDYKPQHITIRSVLGWLNQFDKTDRKALRLLLKKVIYITEDQTKSTLLELNQKLLARLAGAGIPAKNIIYVQVHDAGSSSPLILNTLRDGARLEQRGCRFLDSKDVKGLHQTTNKLEEGAIIFVDDFAGSGNQFCESRDFFAQHIVGSFGEFFLLPCICEEAFQEIEARGVEAIPGFIHRKTERPLHENCNSFNPEFKKHLINLCLRIDRRGGLGYKRMATMVVFYRNAPNTIPVLLRGNPGQQPFWGIFPRTSDLPY